MVAVGGGGDGGVWVVVAVVEMRAQEGEWRCGKWAGLGYGK